MLRYLRLALGDQVYFWPFDGWDIPVVHPAIVEVYPTLWSRSFVREDRTPAQHNPDSHLSGYYRNLVKNGMNPLEANKRVAQALVRVIYRKLASLVEADNGCSADGEDCQEGEVDMASGSTRSGQSHTSNMPLSSPQNKKARDATKVKGRVRSTRKMKNSGRRKRILKKIA